MKIVVAGGGTAGHIEPAMNVADAIKARYPNAEIVALGTVRGLETDLVPARGYKLELIEPVPLPRRLNGDLFSLPYRLGKAIGQCREVLADADLLIGFGGYVALPAYLAARKRVPIVVHEANAKAGLANRVGARFASVKAETVADSIPNAKLTGIPLRKSIAQFDRTKLRAEALEYFKLNHEQPVLLVFGGSQGAQKINQVMEDSRARNLFSQVQVIHAIGAKNELPSDLPSNYHAMHYIDRMDLAYAAADFVISRSGAMTVAELTAVGLPACFVPFPIGNGEQRLNAATVVSAGGALCIADEAFTSDYVAAQVLPVVLNLDRRVAMGEISAQSGHRDADLQILNLIEPILAGVK